MRAALLAVLLVGCSAQKPERLSVDVFAEDTVPVRFSLTVTGTLQMRVNAERSFAQPDRSLVFETPAQLFVYKGDGTALVRALDGTQRFTVQLSGDSTERAAAAGSAFVLTRAKGASTLRIAPQPP